MILNQHILESIVLVEVYIHLRTDKQITINPAQFSNPGNVNKLLLARTHAEAYLAEHNVKITQLN